MVRVRDRGAIVIETKTHRVVHANFALVFPAHVAGALTIREFDTARSQLARVVRRRIDVQGIGIGAPYALQRRVVVESTSRFYFVCRDTLTYSAMKVMSVEAFRALDVVMRKRVGLAVLELSYASLVFINKEMGGLALLAAIVEVVEDFAIRVSIGARLALGGLSEEQPVLAEHTLGIVSLTHDFAIFNELGMRDAVLFGSMDEEAFKANVAI